ncbi:chlorophyll a/b-binding protein [Prochlorococcus sp. MIT 0916]
MSFERLSKTEIVNGRIAMSGLLVIVLLEIVSKLSIA